MRHLVLPQIDMSCFVDTLEQNRERTGVTWAGDEVNRKVGGKRVEDGGETAVQDKNK